MFVFLARIIILVTLIALVSASVSAATAHLAGPQPTLWLARLGRFRRLSYNGFERVPVPPMWRHGVRSRSRGGACYLCQGRNWAFHSG